MMTQRNYISIAVLGMIIGYGSPAIASCEAFLGDMKAAPNGAAPKLDENGDLVSIVMYGEASFLAPKRSLIGKARNIADMAAKRAFVEWINQEDFSAEEEMSSMSETVEVTNQDGKTVGINEDITSYLEAMRSDTSGTIGALAKLDECVDTTENFVIVEFGWKPEFSTAAQAASTTMDLQSGTKPLSEPTEAQEDDSLNLLSKTDIIKSDGYRVTSPLKDEF